MLRPPQLIRGLEKQATFRVLLLRLPMEPTKDFQLVQSHSRFPGRGFTNSVSLELSVASPTADIRYTTNGNVPTASSTRYTGNPITITSSQIIRARAYSNGLAPGPVSEEGYIELSSSAESFSSDIPVVIMERFSGGPSASNGKAYVFFAFFEPDPATGITRLNKTLCSRNSRGV